MTGETETGRDGMIGLGVLLLLTAALVSAESRQTAYMATAQSPSITDRALSVIERPMMGPGEVAGAIRELRIKPLSSRAYPDLNWSPDEVVLEEYRKGSF